MASKDNPCMVIVTIEIGHQANFLKEPSIEGFTHDWTVFVGGYEGSKIEHFVDKVVFNLHKTFKMPTRVISAPPYKVSECGYAGFILPIDIYFKTKQKPRKITFMYDLFLNAKDSPPINNVRYEKLKFQNPIPEFKAKLIKAGGTEQRSGPVQPVVSDRFHNAETKSSSKHSEKKHKEKKKKRVSPPIMQASPNPSLSSLSPMSSEDESEKPAIVKKEKEPPSVVKKESTSSLSVAKKESNKEKSSKHKSLSSEKDKHNSSEKYTDTKPPKLKEKDKSEKSSDHHKEEKKEKESSSQKNKDSHGKHKEREGSHSSSKSSSSSHGEKKSSSSSHKEKSSKDKEISSKEKHKSSHKSRIGEEKSKSKDKEKHSHKEATPATPSVTESAKKSHETSKPKSSHEKEKHSKSSLKRSLSPAESFENDKKKVKKNLAVEADVKVSKASSVEKDKSSSNVLKENKDVKSKDSHKVVSSSSSKSKTKEHKKKSLDKSKHSSHSSEVKSKVDRDNRSVEKKGSSVEKLSEVQQPTKKTGKSSPFTKSEKLAMSADFQPQLLLSPLQSRSDDEEIQVFDSKKERSGSKRSKSISSLSSLSSSKSDNEDEVSNDKTKQIVSGLTDSDSDSDGEPFSKSPPKVTKPANPSKDPAKPKKSSSLSTVDKIKKSHGESGMVKSVSSPSNNKASGLDGKDYGKKKSESKGKSKNVDSSEVFSSPKTSPEEAQKNGLNVLAPNGIPVGELITLNEKIVNAQLNSNKDLINNIIDIISETDLFDIDDSDVTFDICSLDKNSVLQIQNLLLRE